MSASAGPVFAGTCLFAHYDADGLVDPLTLRYLAELGRCGLRVHVLTTENTSAEAVTALAGVAAEVIVRLNRGLDFGAWAHGLAHLGGAIEGDLLLANDSVIGPIGPLEAALARLAAMDADVKGMVASAEIRPHLQSWFLLLGEKARSDPAFLRVMSQDFAAMPKRDIVRRGEIGFSEALLGAGLRLTALAGREAVQGRPLIHQRFNASHYLWREVIGAYGVPFLKREALRDNPAGLAQLSDWRDVLRAEGGEELVAMVDAWLARARRAPIAIVEHRAPPFLSDELLVRRADAALRSGRRVTAKGYGLAAHLRRAPLVAARGFHWIRSRIAPRAN